MNKDAQFHEWLMGRGPFPFYKDIEDVHYPIGFGPLSKQINEHSRYRPAKKIEVKDISHPVDIQFVPYGNGQRAWITDDGSWYKSVGWCPHINIGGGECRDCALVLEDE